MFQLCGKDDILLVLSSTTADHITHFTPAKTFMIADRTIDAKGKSLKPPEAAEDEEKADPKGYPLCFLCESSRREDEVIKEVGQHEDGEVERWKLERSQPGAHQTSQKERT